MRFNLYGIAGNGGKIKCRWTANCQKPTNIFFRRRSSCVLSASSHYQCCNVYCLLRRDKVKLLKDYTVIKSIIIFFFANQIGLTARFIIEMIFFYSKIGFVDSVSCIHLVWAFIAYANAFFAFVTERSVYFWPLLSLKVSTSQAKIWCQFTY